MTVGRRERIPLLWRTVRKECWSKFLVLTWGGGGGGEAGAGGVRGRMVSIRESAEEQRCLEGVYTARTSER